MATASFKLGGTSHWPLELLPQATTRPLSSRARLCQAPAAMATALVRSGGTLICPQELSPHAPACTTASSASELRAEPKELVTLTEYWPLLVARAEATV